MAFRAALTWSMEVKTQRNTKDFALGLGLAMLPRLAPTSTVCSVASLKPTIPLFCTIRGMSHLSCLTQKSFMDVSKRRNRAHCIFPKKEDCLTVSQAAYALVGKSQECQVKSLRRDCASFERVMIWPSWERRLCFQQQWTQPENQGQGGPECWYQ